MSVSTSIDVLHEKHGNRISDAPGIQEVIGFKELLGSSANCLQGIDVHNTDYFISIHNYYFSPDLLSMEYVHPKWQVIKHKYTIVHNCSQEK